MVLLKVSPNGINSQMLWRLISPVQSERVSFLMWDTDLSFRRDKPHNCEIPLACIHLDVALYSLLQRGCSACFQLFCRMNCFICSSRYVMSTERCEFKIFPCCFIFLLYSFSLSFLKIEFNLNF